MNDPAAAVRAALQKGHTAEALRIAKAHAASHAGDASAARLHAIVASEIGDAGAGDAWRVVLALRPDDVEAHYMLGNVCGERGDFAAAAEHFRSAIAHSPRHHPQLRASLGLALDELGRAHEAEACFREALAGLADPPFPLLAALARNLFRQRRFAEALDHFDTLSRRFGIDDAGLSAAYAACLAAAGREREADGAFRSALAAAPGAPKIARDYAAFLMRAGRHQDAVAILERSGAAESGDLLATSLLLICRLQLADWHDVDALRAAVIERVKQGLSGADDVVPAYDFLALCDDPLLQRGVAERWASDDAPIVTATVTHAQPTGGHKIKLGFVSSDYSNHPVGRLVVGLLERLDRSRFDVTAYATSASASDGFGARIEAAVDRYRRLDRRDPENGAQLIRDDAIDLLFDLNGFSGGEAIRLFARRPAPVQINFLGYTGTLGCGAYDFIVADNYCVPADQQRAFAERLIQVNPCYLPSDPARSAAKSQRTRADYGLPEKGFVFCAFAAIYKIVPELFATWMGMLRTIPNSILWLRHLPADRLERLRDEARRRGVDGARLVAAPGEGIDRYLARFGLADLLLDSFPFGSHTTVNDALFSGLPVVTVAGRSFASRASASQLHAVGLPALVAPDLPKYAEIALALASDSDRLKRVELTLHDATSRAALFDMDRYARAFEAAVVNAYEAHATGPRD